jgi:nucleoside 2-deoxyribosyltransferase
MGVSNKLVYLAGPITGLTYEGATNWRQYAIKKLKPIFGLSPMRGKDYLLEERSISATGYDQTLSRDQAIIARDRFDCQRADLIIVNLLGATRVSIGTMVELGWADAARVPVVLIMEKGNVHDHTFVNQLAGFRAESLDEAIDLAKIILIEETGGQ